MSEVKTLVTLILGGVFDHKEIGDIDVAYDHPACEALQRELVKDSDDVCVELVSRIDFDAAQSELAALREELTTLKTKHERTESALRGSMKALTRVDNMWKKRWLDKTGEAAMALIVDDEFKALFEEIKDYRQRLAAAEQRNTEMVELLRAHTDHVAALCDVMFRFGLGMDKEPEQKIYSALAQQQVVFAALKPTESGASE